MKWRAPWLNIESGTRLWTFKTYYLFAVVPPSLLAAARVDNVQAVSEYIAKGADLKGLVTSVDRLR